MKVRQFLNAPGPKDIHDICNIVGALCLTGFEVSYVLGLVGLGGPTKVGEVNLLLSAVPLARNSGFLPLPNLSAELLPISPVLARVFLSNEFCSSQDATVLAALQTCLGTLAALNCLYVVGLGPSPIIPQFFPCLSDAQKRTLMHLFLSCIRFLDDSCCPFSLKEEQTSLLEKRFSYSGDMVSVRRKLVAEKVFAAWPAVGFACVCPIINFVDEHLRDLLLDPRGSLLPEAEWPEQTPCSKVHATDAEWYSLVKGGVARGIFCHVPESEIFTNQHGDLVLNGAMGVDKFKEVNGVLEQQLRFIAIFTPLNVYSRKFPGDSWLLPQAPFLSQMILGEDEFCWTDGEDLQSCFNLFTIEDCWKGYFAFSKKVSMAAFGGPSGEFGYVSMRAVPMGWTNSVDVIQNFIRRFVFQTCGLPPDLEVRKDAPISGADVAVVCMDGFDLVSKIKVVQDSLFQLPNLFCPITLEDALKWRVSSKNALSGDFL
jgi:hypothetical protein